MRGKRRFIIVLLGIFELLNWCAANSMSGSAILSSFRSRTVIVFSGIIWLIPILLIILVHIGILKDLRNGEDPMLGWTIHNTKITAGLFFSGFGFLRYTMPVILHFPKTRFAVEKTENGMILDGISIKNQEISDIYLDKNIIHSIICIKLKDGRKYVLYTFMTKDRMNPKYLLSKLRAASKI